jgi:NADP-dependent 3-hydroxy acid dehydrogenase YdfG
MRPSPIALVTGANRGIGREVCRQLAENRMRVLIGARDPAKGEAAALQMARGGFDVEAVALDVTDAASIQALGDKLGAADVLINNAGVDYDTDQTPISADLARVRKTRQQRLPGLAIDRYGRPGRHVQDGAASVVWAAMLPDDGPTGGFFRNGRPVAW